MKRKNENKQNGKRDNPEAENSLQFVHICKLLVCGSVGRGFFRVRVTSIEHICNMKHPVPLSSFGSSHSLFQKYWWFSVSRHSKQIKIKIKTVQNPRQDTGQKNISYTRYPKKCFTQIYRDLYGDSMLMPTWMSTNMADGNQQKHLLPSFGTKA